jgi:autophagy-related protein 11
MDNPVPTIDFSPSGNSESSSLECEGVNGTQSDHTIWTLLILKIFSGLLHVLDDLEKSSQSNNDVPALTAAQECWMALDKLIL